MVQGESAKSARAFADTSASWQPLKMKLIGEFTNPIGKRRLRVYERDDGRFWFEEFYEEFDIDAGLYWSPVYQSGLYADVASARADVFAVIPWLRPKPH